MRRLVTGVIVSSVLTLACQTRKAPSAPSPRAGLRLTTGTIARQLSRQFLHVNIAFGLAERGVNGTGILLDFLQRMETYRAAYVSDVSYALQMTYNGTTIECVSKIRVDDGTLASGPATAATPNDDGEADFTTTVKPWRPRETDAWVVDRDMVCKQRAQQVRADLPRYDNLYNAEIGRSMFGRPMPVETTTIVYYDQCTYRPSRRYVQRYEHFVAARFSPPDLDIVRNRYADLPLVHEPPLCHQIELAPGQALRQHIAADVHFPPQVVPDRDNIFIPLPQLRGIGAE